MQITCSIKFGMCAVVSAMMLLERRIQSGHGLRKALPEPAGGASVMPAGWKEGEKASLMMFLVLPRQHL